MKAEEFAQRIDEIGEKINNIDRMLFECLRAWKEDVESTSWKNSKTKPAIRPGGTLKKARKYFTEEYTTMATEIVDEIGFMKRVRFIFAVAKALHRTNNYPAVKFVVRNIANEEEILKIARSRPGRQGLMDSLGDVIIDEVSKVVRAQGDAK